MKNLMLLLAALLLPLPALAQDTSAGTPPPVHTSPDASPDVSNPDVSNPGTSNPDVSTPGTSSPDDSSQPPAPKPAPTPTPEPPSPTWEPHQVALLQALDKVDGQTSQLTIAVGQTQVYRNISINVRSCFARPPDQAQDAATYLIIQDVGQNVPDFVGWMLSAEPAASMMQHPVYDVRVLGCR